MTKLEFFAICIGLSILALAWLAGDVSGVLFVAAGAIAGNIDLSWIESKEVLNAQSTQAADGGDHPGVALIGGGDDDNLHSPTPRPVSWHRLPSDDLRPSLQWWKKYQERSNVIQMPRRQVS